VSIYRARQLLSYASDRKYPRLPTARGVGIVDALVQFSRSPVEGWIHLSNGSPVERTIAAVRLIPNISHQVAQPRRFSSDLNQWPARPGRRESH
jgi:hypothetical protein